MQDEVNERTISFCITTGKMSADLLRKAMIAFLDGREKKSIKKLRKNERKNLKKQADKQKHGKQSLKKLTGQNVQLSNIEITDQNIKAFDQVARKYGIDYSLKKDTMATPSRYYVFFKARDVDVMTAAFREFTGRTMVKKPSVLKRLQALTSHLGKGKHRERSRKKEKHKEQTL